MTNNYVHRTILATTVQQVCFTFPGFFCCCCKSASATRTTEHKLACFRELHHFPPYYFYPVFFQATSFDSLATLSPRAETCRLFGPVLFLYLMPPFQDSGRLILPKPSNRPRETAGKWEPTYPVHSVPTSSSLVSSFTFALAARRKTKSNCR